MSDTTEFLRGVREGVEVSSRILARVAVRIEPDEPYCADMLTEISAALLDVVEAELGEFA